MATTVFHIEGGIGKNVAATAVIAAYKKAKPKRNILVVTAWPEIWIGNTNISRFYRIGNTPYFYKDVIKGKDIEIYSQDPYKQTSHITKKSHLIKTWCDMIGVKYNDEQPELNFNFREVEEGRSIAQQVANNNEKPILIFQPFGGPGPEHQQHPYSWTRDIHPQHAQKIVDGVNEKYNVLHVCYEFHPKLNNCNRLDKIISKKVLFALLAFSQKRILIDSSLQHAAAALKLPSTVAWVATQKEVFGYDLHNNFKPKTEFLKGHVDSYLYDYIFTGPTHECPFKSIDDIHDIDGIVQSVLKD